MEYEQRPFFKANEKEQPFLTQSEKS